MATDMDIDMDLDVGLMEDEAAGPEMEILPEAEVAPDATGPNETPSEDALQPCPQKVHLRGLDDLTTKDIKLFAAEHFSNHEPTNIEWIDDTSANLVYETEDIARDALIAFASTEITDPSQIPTLQSLPAKSHTLRPETRLEVRMAVQGDRKQAGARERSRFYLFNPEFDPAERRKRNGGNKYRDRDDGGYRSRRYDDREHRKRQDGDRDAGFDDTLYDDDEAALAQRAARRDGRRDSVSSGSDYRGRRSRRVRSRGGAGKELFPDRGDKSSGRLRDRSASPPRDNNESLDDARSRSPRRRVRNNAAFENRRSAQMIKARLQEAASAKELFPHTTGINHRRSDAFDAADSTADLFASKMPVPFMDGSSDERPKAGRASEQGRLNIRGAAKASAVHDFAIKGMAPGTSVKELFPAHTNVGKELFADRLGGRGTRRQRAEDLFS